MKILAPADQVYRTQQSQLNITTECKRGVVLGQTFTQESHVPTLIFSPYIRNFDIYCLIPSVQGVYLTTIRLFRRFKVSPNSDWKPNCLAEVIGEVKFPQIVITAGQFAPGSAQTRVGGPWIQVTTV